LVDVDGNLARREDFPPLAPSDTPLDALPAQCARCFCRAACYEHLAPKGA